MAEYNVPMDKVPWCFETINRLNTEEDTNNVVLELGLEPRKFPISQIHVGSLEMPTPQMLVEDAWNRFYFDEGVPRLEVDKYAQTDHVRSFVVGFINDQNQEEYFESRLIPHLNPLVQIRAVTLDAQTLAEQSDLVVNPAVPVGTVSGILVTTHVAHALDMLDFYDWGDPVRLTGIHFGGGNTFFNLTSGDIQIVSDKEFFIPAPVANAVKVATTPFKDYSGFLCGPQVPNPSTLARLITQGFLNSGLPAGLDVIFYPESTCFGIKMASTSPAGRLLYARAIQREESQTKIATRNHTQGPSASALSMPHNKYVRDPFSPQPAFAKRSVVNLSADLFPFIEGTLLSNLLGFTVSTHHRVPLGFTMSSMGSSKSCDVKAAHAYRGLSCLKIPPGNYDPSPLGSKIIVQWNRFWFDAGTENNEVNAAKSASGRLQAFGLSADPSVSLVLNGLASITSNLPPVTGAGLPLLSEKSSMGVFSFTTPEGHMQSFTVPFGKYTYEGIADYVGKMMTRLDTKRVYQVTYGVVPEGRFYEDRVILPGEKFYGFTISSLDGAEFSLEFDLGATMQMVFFMGFDGINYRGASSYSSSNPVEVPAIPVFGTNLFADYNIPVPPRYHPRNLGQVFVRPQRKYAITAQRPQPFAVRVEAVQLGSLTLVSLDQSGETVFAHGLAVGDVLHMRNPCSFSTVAAPARQMFHGEEPRQMFHGEEPRTIEAATPGFELPPDLYLAVSAVEDAFRFTVVTGSLDFLSNAQIGVQGYRSASLAGPAVCNLYFGEQQGCDNPRTLKPSILGFKETAYEWQFFGTQFPGFTSPLQFLLEGPRYLLLVMEDPPNSSNTQHTFKGKKKFNILAKVLLYPSIRLERMQEMNVDNQGTGPISKIRLALYNPDHTPYQMHNCDWSGTLVFVGPRMSVTMPDV
jgi:hypothetical protein